MQLAVFILQTNYANSIFVRLIDTSSESTNNQTKKILTHNSSVVCFYTRQTELQRTNQVR